MEFDVLDSFADLNYSDLVKDSSLKEALEDGPKSILFTQSVEWFSKQLQSLLCLDSYVNAITDASDSNIFILEVSTFLKELKCPYKDLTSGSLDKRLLDVKSRLTLLDYLSTELQAARILHSSAKKSNVLEISVDASDVATSLNLVQKTLKIESNEECGVVELFSELQEKINHKAAEHPFVKPIFSESLTEEQWGHLSSLFEDCLQEYAVRREMLLTRLDVTLQSFKWGEGSKGKEDSILKAYVQKRSELKKMPAVLLSDVLAATDDLLIVEKTSSATLIQNTKSSLNRIIIPPVPDRGGRPKEQRPPVEMPQWQKRSEGGHGGRGRGRGGKSQHQWSPRGGRKKRGY